MWYRLAIVTDDLDMAKVNEYMSILRASPKPRIKFRDLLTSIGDMSPDRAALQAAWQSINNESGSNPTPKPPSPPKPNPNPAPAPNTTVKDLIPLDQLEKRDSNEGPSDLIVRPPGGELDLYKPKKEDDDPEKPKKDDGDCIIEEEVFIQNLLTGLTGYAQIYFKKKIFTISQDTYGGNRSPLAPVQTALGLTPPGRLDPNTQAYDPASATGSPLGNFARRPGPIKDSKGRIMTDASGAPLTMSAPTKDKTVVWNTADVQSIMSSLEKIAQMPELQKYGAKEIANILRYPLLQVKNEYEKIDEEKEKIDESIKEITDKIGELYEKMRENHYEYQQIEILKNDVSKPKTPAELLSLEAKQRKIYEDSSRLGPLELKYKENIIKLNSKKTKLDNIKPEVEVVPFKDFYKLTELSRYYIYKGSQLNGVFCTLETQLIKTLDNTLNTLGKMEKNKRLKDIYENARGKK
jgi:hypothetical protein